MTSSSSDGMIRQELTSKKQLARRGGYWDVVGNDYYLDSDQSDSEDNERDQDDANKYVLGEIFEELD